jgi:twinkle protein
MEPGGKLVFWAMDLCSPDMPVTICEGEFDAAVLWQAGIQAVSLPNGCNNLDCVDLCWDWLKQFPSYYIWTDNDEGGIKAREELIKRLGVAKCQIIAHPKFKDANEVLYREGQDGVISV